MRIAGSGHRACSLPVSFESSLLSFGCQLVFPITRHTLSNVGRHGRTYDEWFVSCFAGFDYKLPSHTNIHLHNPPQHAHRTESHSCAQTRRTPQPPLTQRTRRIAGVMCFPPNVLDHVGCTMSNVFECAVRLSSVGQMLIEATISFLVPTTRYTSVSVLLMILFPRMYRKLSQELLSHSSLCASSVHLVLF